jgi:predicted TIM-barrel fold metal-dependent hydrolase
MLAQHTAHLSEAERRLVLHDNVAELFGLSET